MPPFSAEKGLIITEHDIQFYRNNVITPLRNCREEFTENVWAAYEDRSIDDFLKGLCQKHGYDVVATLISERIKDCLWDGRYSRDIKNWAENYKTSLPVDEISERVLQSSASMDTHPVILNFCAGTLIEIKEEMQKSSSEEPTETENKSAVDQLYEKMSAAQDVYRDWLLSQPPSEILNHTYEYTIREDILYTVESGEITEDEAKELLKSENPLDEVYDRFDKNDVSYMEEIREAFSEAAKERAGKAAENVKG